MNKFLKSRLVLTLSAFVLIAAAIGISFLSFPFTAFAAGGTFTASNYSYDINSHLLSFHGNNFSPDNANWWRYGICDIPISGQNALTNNTDCAYTDGIHLTGDNLDVSVTLTNGLLSLSSGNVYIVMEDYNTGQEWLSQSISDLFNSSPTPTPTPTSTMTPTPIPTPLVTLSGNVFVDSNSNGVQDAGENNYVGAVVTISEDTANLSNTSQQTATTDVNGNYSFTVDQSGNYWMSLAVPSGYMGTTKALVNVVTNSNTTQNFGIVQATPKPIVFSDTFTDANGTPLTTHNSLWSAGQQEPVIENNTLYAPGPTNSSGQVFLPSFVLGDQCSSIDFLSPTVGIISIFARENPNGSGGYTGYGSDLNTNPNPSTYSLSLYRDGQYFGGTGVDFPKSALSTGWHNFKICAIGSQISNYIDNTLVNSATDATYAQGFPGFGISTGNYLDNFKLEGNNNPPVINPIPPQTINEGDTYSNTGSFTDPDSSSWTATVNYGDGGAQLLTLSGTNFALNHVYQDEGTYTVTVSIRDNQGATGTQTAIVTVKNALFSIGAITVPNAVLQVNSALSASASFTDPGGIDTHTASWNWGDGSTTTGTVTESNGSGSVSDSHTYTASGVYTVTLTVTDDDGVSNTSTYQYVSVYNPTAQGLFSAGEHFTSPAGAYSQNLSLTGIVKFGLSYKYQGSVPVGDKEFSLNFNAANFQFSATSVSSLVLTNGIGTLRGTGTVNGAGTYSFLVTGSESANTIRIQIKDASGNVIYDTQPGAADTANPTTSVTGHVLAH
jgi:PKD repeat protein